MTVEQLDAVRQAEIDAYVKRGMITPRQAYTLAVMNQFTDALFAFGYVRFPPDEAVMRRIETFLDAWIDREIDQEESLGQSYFLEESEEPAFVMAGLRCGTENSTAKDTLSAVLMTNRRLFVFDNKEDDSIPASLRDSVPPMASVIQMPLKSVRHVTLKRESEFFPHGSFELCFQTPQILMQHYWDTMERVLSGVNDPEMTEKWRKKMAGFTGLQTYEMEIRGPDARMALLSLLPLLQEISREHGFPVTNELGIIAAPS